jgi:hypothetical protein
MKLNLWCFNNFIFANKMQCHAFTALRIYISLMFIFIFILTSVSILTYTRSVGLLTVYKIPKVKENKWSTFFQLDFHYWNVDKLFILIWKNSPSFCLWNNIYGSWKWALFWWTKRSFLNLSRIYHSLTNCMLWWTLNVLQDLTQSTGSRAFFPIILLNHPIIIPNQKNPLPS